MHFAVASAIKEFLNQKDMMAAADLVDGLNEVMEAALTRGIERAKENGRKTVRPCDL